MKEWAASCFDPINGLITYGAGKREVRPDDFTHDL